MLSAAEKETSTCGISQVCKSRTRKLGLRLAPKVMSRFFVYVRQNFLQYAAKHSWQIVFVKSTYL